MKEIVLAGNSITAAILFSYIRTDGRYRVVATVVDDDYTDRGSVEGLPCIGISSILRSYPPTKYGVIMAMGYSDLNRPRESMFRRLKEFGYPMETYIHPHARVYSEFKPGDGCIVLPGAIVEPFVQLGEDTFLWCNTTLAHHSEIGDHCWVASGAVVSGQSRVRHHTFLGVNSTIVNNITVGEYNIVGGGALITKDTKPSTVHLARSAEQIRFSAEDYTSYFRI